MSFGSINACLVPADHAYNLSTLSGFELEIKAGVVEGTVYDAKGMQAIAAIPSRDVLISKLLGSLQSPITNFARVMNQLAEKGGASACEAPAAAEEAVEEAPAAE